MLVCLQVFAAAQCTQRHVYRPFGACCLAQRPHRFPERNPLMCKSKINLHAKPDNFKLFLSHTILHNEDVSFFQILLLPCLLYGENFSVGFLFFF